MFVALAVPGPSLLVGMAFFLDRSFFSGVFVGLALALSVFGLWYPFVMGGQHVRSIGADAEGFTSGTLRKLDRKRWAVIDDVAFEKHNIDHVLVGPTRVLAVETKWRSGELRLADRRTIAQTAAQNARRLRLLLGSEGAACEVEPLVVIWGPAQGGLSRFGEEVEGVEFVPGPQSKRWLPVLDASDPDAERNVAVLQALGRYLDRRERTPANTR